MSLLSSAQGGARRHDLVIGRSCLRPYGCSGTIYGNIKESKALIIGIAGSGPSTSSSSTNTTTTTGTSTVCKVRCSESTKTSISLRDQEQGLQVSACEADQDLTFCCFFLGWS